MAKRRIKIQDEDVVTDFTVEDVLSPPVEFDHEHFVRSVGPP